MNRSALRELLLYAPITQQNHQKIPSALGGLVFSRPTDSKRNIGKGWMYFRSVLLVSVGLYVFFGSPSYDEMKRLFVVLVIYELAYIGLWKEKMDLEQRSEREAYERKVEEALDEHFQ